MIGAPALEVEPNVWFSQGALLELDEPAARAWRWWRERGAVDPAELEKEFGPELATELAQTLARKPAAPTREPRLKALVLNVVESCNLACTYCYAGLEPGRKAMDRDTAFQAVDYLKATPGRVKITFFGGEPLLNFPLIREVVEYAAEPRVSFSLTEMPVRHPDAQGEGETDIVAEWPHWLESQGWVSVPYSELDAASGKWFLGMFVVDLKTGEADKVEAGPPPDQMVAFSSIVAPGGKRGYLIFSQLLTMDLENHKALRVDALPRSYSVMTISGDGKRLFAGGSGSSVMEFDTENSKVVREVDLPFEVTELYLVPQ